MSPTSCGPKHAAVVLFMKPQVEEREQDYEPDFLRHIYPRLNWPALREGAAAMGASAGRRGAEARLPLVPVPLCNSVPPSCCGRSQPLQCWREPLLGCAPEAFRRGSRRRPTRAQAGFPCRTACLPAHRRHRRPARACPKGTQAGLPCYFLRACRRRGRPARVGQRGDARG